MLSKANFFHSKKGRGPIGCSTRAQRFYRSVAAAAIAIAAAFAAAPTAAMLVGVPCGPAHTAKHDSTYNNGRQIKVRGQEFHHTEHTLSNWTDDFT
jgi:hypothetical protein